MGLRVIPHRVSFPTRPLPMGARPGPRWRVCLLALVRDQRDQGSSPKFVKAEAYPVESAIFDFEEAHVEAELRVRHLFWKMSNPPIANGCPVGSALES